MDFFDPDAESRKLEQQPNKFEYYYSLKKFGAKDIVYEREPHRLIEIQDPLLYRGQLGAAKRTWQDTNKVFIVNGVIEKQDGNLNGGFFFNKVKDAKIIIGTYPMTLNDVLRIKKAGATAVLNLQTGREMDNRGVDWPKIKTTYAEAGILRTLSYPIDDSNPEELIESLFTCAKHLNTLINDQGHTVYVSDNSAITRAPTLVLTYLCLFLKLRTMENLKEAERLLKQYHQMSSPNTNAIKALLKKQKAFVEEQRHLLGECDSSDEGQPNEEGIFLLRRKEYNKNRLSEV